MLNNEVSNIASIPFVAMALQTQEEINAAYMRKMNRDYATDIRNLFQASESHLQELQYRITSNKETSIE